MSLFNINVPHIFELILSHLNAEDFLNCMLVNKTWYEAIQNTIKDENAKQDILNRTSESKWLKNPINIQETEDKVGDIWQVQEDQGPTLMTLWGNKAH